MHILGIHFAVAPANPASAAELHAIGLDQNGTLSEPSYCDANRPDQLSFDPRPDLVVVDTPIAVPNRHGRRAAEELLAWCDIPTFPVSVARLETLYGGMPGAPLVEHLAATDVVLAESLPRVVLRELLWERETDGAYIDLAEYRERWLGVRGPDPVGRGRRRPTDPDLAATRDLLEGALGLPDACQDMPGPTLAALACAYAGLRASNERWGPTLRLGLDHRHELVLPADVNLIRRCALHGERQAQA